MMLFRGGRVSIIIATGLLIVSATWSMNVIADLFMGSSEDIMESLFHPGLRETAKRLAIIIIVIGITGYFLEIEKNRKNLIEEQGNLYNLIDELEDNSKTLKTLKNLLPTCVTCNSIRDDSGLWHELDIYIEKYPDAVFTEGYCPGCTRKMKREAKKTS
jgi:hypothetical protein